MKCFSEKGYVATTLKDISTRAGYTHGAFYGHFSSKEELFLHVLAYQHQLTAGWTETPRQYRPADTSLEDVLTITVARLGEMLHGVDNWILVLAEYFQYAKHDPAAGQLFKDKYSEWVSEIETLVLVLQERGWIPPDKDSRLIARQVLAFNEGYSLFAVFSGERDIRPLIQGLAKLMS